MRGQKITLVIICILIAIFVLLGLRRGATKALFDAIDRESVHDVQKAIDCFADVNGERHGVLGAVIAESNATPLIQACKKGNFEIVKILVENGADVNQEETKMHSTPLVCALKANREDMRFEIAYYLMENGAVVPKTHPYPIEYELMESVYITPNASEKEKEASLSMFQYLLQYHTIEKANENGLYTVFTLACYYNNIDVVLYMLDNNLADVNEQERSGMTGLMECGMEGNKEMCEILLARGADTSLMDNDGKTAYDYAVEHGHEDVAKILLAAQ